MEFKGTLDQFQGGNFALVQNCEEINSYNERYDTFFDGFLIEFFNDDYAVKIYGIEGSGYDLVDNVYFVSDL